MRARPPARAAWARCRAAGLPVAFALQRAYDVGAARPHDYAGADAREQGAALLVVVIGCVVVAGGAAVAALRARPAAACGSGRLADAPPRVRGRRGAALLAARGRRRVAFDLPDRIDEQRKAFVRGQRAAAAAAICAHG